jgi:hypothetical protein
MTRTLVFLCLCLPLGVQAILPLPEGVASKLPGLSLAGEGRLRWFGLHIYDAALWARTDVFSVDSEFALDIRYMRNIPAERLVGASVKEIRRLGYADDALLDKWSGAMGTVFPDIRKGDRLTGVNMPGRGVEFYHNGRFAGLIPDTQFARAFFSIWFDPRTREPELRESLIGLN